MDSGERQRNISTVQNGGWARRNDDGEIRGLFLSLIKVGRTSPRETQSLRCHDGEKYKIRDGPDGLTTDRTDLSDFSRSDVLDLLLLYLAARTISF